MQLKGVPCQSFSMPRTSPRLLKCKSLALYIALCWVYSSPPLILFKFSARIKPLSAMWTYEIKDVFVNALLKSRSEAQNTDKVRGSSVLANWKFYQDIYNQYVIVLQLHCVPQLHDRHIPAQPNGVPDSHCMPEESGGRCLCHHEVSGSGKHAHEVRLTTEGSFFKGFILEVDVLIYQ